MNKLAFAALAAALVLPAAARADIGLRLGAEAMVAHHNSNTGTSIITDNWPLAGDVMLSYWIPSSILSFDAEFSEAFLLSPPAGASSRQGSTLRIGATFSPPVLPFYVRAAIPLHLEPSPFYSGLRVGAGMTGNLLLFKLYLEADADFPLFGGSGSPGAFSSQDFSLGAGVQFKF